MFDSNTKILIVDDMSTMRKIVKKSCLALGLANVEEAEDGFKAWEKLQASQDFDLIISDWNMPNCTGLEFLKRVRADARFKNIPFVLLTAESEASQIAQAISCGVSNYIVKPFSQDVLKQKLEAIHKKISAAS